MKIATTKISDILLEEDPAPTPEQEPLATREEIELLALCAMAEAEGECEQGQKLQDMKIATTKIRRQISNFFIGLSSCEIVVLVVDDLGSDVADNRGICSVH